MAGNFLQIGISGLLSSQSAITTASNNIANVNTEGYSRQFVDFSARQPNFIGGNFIGTGAEASNVKRVFDELALFDLRASISNFNSLDTYVTQADRVDRIVADPTTGLSPAIQGFFDAMQAVADEPQSSATRQAALSQTDLLIERFEILNSQLVGQRISINEEISNVAGQISVIGRNIADINADIVFAKGRSANGAEPNDLLDKRDNLINQLSALVSVSTVEENDGALNVFIGNGQTLVIGVTSNTIQASPDPADPFAVRLEFVDAGTVTPVSNDIVGGKIGGLINYTNDLLQPALNRLNLVALGISDAINQQHQIGVDLNGALGGNFFTDINTALAEQGRVIPSTENAGSANITMTIDDVNALRVNDYRLSYSLGTNTFTITDATNNTVIDSFVNPGLPSSYTNASLGFTLNLNSGVLADGDNFKLAPTRGAIDNLDRELNDVTQLAAGFPINARTSSANTGSASIVGSTVTDTNTAAFSIPGNLNPPIRLEFTSATTYDVINNTTNAVISGGVVYDPNQTNNMLSQAGLNLGYEIQISGAADAGDVFSVAYNSSGRGDNRNALAMAGKQTENLLNQGTSTLQEAYGLLVSEVGTRTNENRISLSASQSLLRQNETRLEEVSGVNLDEEAAKLIRFQQSYQAAARIITTSQVIFDTLISSVN
jgi:flagellar hook-associated protein 1 FlgK